MIRRIVLAVLAALLLAACGTLPLPDQGGPTALAVPSITSAATSRTPARSTASATAPTTMAPTSTPAAKVRIVDYTSPPTVTGAWPTGCHTRGNLPDPRCTPGSAAPRTKAQVCMSGFSAGVRPLPSNTEKAKTTAMRAYGIPLAQRTTTELDHLVPLELGGSNDVTNLWSEASDIPNATFRNTKDGVENRVHAAVCRPGSPIALDAAQAALAQNWTTALAVLGIR